MKKNYTPLIIVLVICAILVGVSFLKENKTPTNTPDNDDIILSSDELPDNKKTEVNNNEEVFETKQNNSDEEKNKTNDSKADKKNEETKKEEKTIKSGKGLFLGMDDSNFLVIFMSDENGTPKEYRFAIDRNLNFENSDIEIGDSVNFEYETDSKDTKIITKISK